MTRATIADISKRAGVSTATVDRALNGRKGVSAANRQRVMRAARLLGYLPSEGILALPSRPARLSFLIPTGGNTFLQDMAGAITRFSDAQPLVESCRIQVLDGIGPDPLIEALDNLPPDTDGIGVVATDDPRSRDALRRMCESGIRVVTLASDVLATPRSGYVGVNNMVAGRTAAQILGMSASDGAGDVAVFFGTHAYHGHSERELGFRSCLSAYYPTLTALPSVETGENGERLYRELTRLYRSGARLVGVYCVGAGRKGLVQALETIPQSERPLVVMHDLTEDTRRWLAEGLIHAVIDQNAHLIGEQAVIRLLGAIASGPVQLPMEHIEPRIILRENIPAGRVSA